MITLLNAMASKKWRGIKTTSKKINESKAKTIVNRLGQKSISLPRIDDKKRWAGYPGLAGTAREIAKVIREYYKSTKQGCCGYYIEPFAGTAKVFQELLKDPVWFHGWVLNDKSKFIYDWLNEQWGMTGHGEQITNMDFKDLINEFKDDESAFFLIDPPWNKSYYLQNFSSFNRKSVKDYDLEVLKLCREIKGKFIITTRRENKIMLNSEFNKAFIVSEYVVSGKYPKVLITTNLDLK